MMRMLFVPQFPSELRYQEWWYWKLPVEFEKRGLEVKVIGEDALNTIIHRRSTLDMFSPINQAIEFECEQIKEYMNLELRDNDMLFWSDLSFPGLFGHVLFHKRPKRMFAFCHATAKNNYDYYEPVRQFKFPIESSIASMFDKIFVGSKYHQNKLGWNNTQVTYLPFYPSLYEDRIIDVPKTMDIMSASRPSAQKVDSELEDKIEKYFNLKIQRPNPGSWFDYHWNLNSAKILLITAKEDTFGYQIVDAVKNHCIPLARRDFAYPELLSDDYLYESEDELFNKIDYILNANVDWAPKIVVPKLLCEEQMNKFYDNIYDTMMMWFKI